MRVLLISPNYHGGGAERCARDLFDHLPSVGVETEMWVAVRRPDDPPGVKCIRIPGERWGYPLNWLPTINDWRHVGSIRKLDAIRPGDFDVVHLHNIHGDWISIRAVQRLCQRMPVVWTLHDEWAVTGGMVCDLTRVLPLAEVHRLSAAARFPRRTPLHPGPWATRWRRFLSKHMPRPARIITPSQWMAGLARQAPWFQGVPVEVIPNGLPLLDEPAIDMPRDDARRRWNLPLDRPCVLLIATDMRLPYKGVHLAVEVLAELAAKIPADARPSVLLMGRSTGAVAGPLRTQLNYEVREGWAATAFDLASAYRAADATLITSLADNFPYTVIESFACATPVVGFAVGGIRDQVGMNERGLLARAFDRSEMIAHLLPLLGNPSLQRVLGMQGKNWVSATCNYQRYRDHAIHIYRQAVDERLRSSDLTKQP